MFSSKSLNASKQKIDALFELVDPVDEFYFELRSHWAQYMAVKVSGFMEEVIETVFLDYIKDRTAPQVARYAKKQIHSSKANPNHEKFLKILGAFNSEWSQTYEQFVEEEGRKDALNSIIGWRHRVAHGASFDISLVRVKDYYAKCIDIAEEIERIVNG